MHNGAFAYYIIISAFAKIMALSQKEGWQPSATNKGCCEFKDIFAYGHKFLWGSQPPPAANMGSCKFKDIVAYALY